MSADASVSANASCSASDWIGVDAEEGGVDLWDASNNAEASCAAHRELADLLESTFWEEYLGRTMLLDGANFQPHHLSSAQQYDLTDLEEIEKLAELHDVVLYEFPSRASARMRRERWPAEEDRDKSRDAETMVWFVQQHPEFSLRRWHAKKSRDERALALREEIKDQINYYIGLRKWKPEEEKSLRVIEDTIDLATSRDPFNEWVIPRGYTTDPGGGRLTKVLYALACKPDGTPREESPDYLIREVGQATSPYGHPNIVRAQLLHFHDKRRDKAVYWGAVKAMIRAIRAASFTVDASSVAARRTPVRRQRGFR